MEKGPGFRGTQREEGAGALNPEGPQGSAARTPTGRGFVPRQFLLWLPPAPGTGGQAQPPRRHAGGLTRTWRREHAAVVGFSGTSPFLELSLQALLGEGKRIGLHRRCKTQSHRERKISKIALVVQPRVNSSISPAADRSNGQETTVENKAPPLLSRTSPARPPRAALCSFWDEDVGRGFRPSSLHYLSPFLWGEQVQRGKERREGRGAPAGNRAAL